MTVRVKVCCIATEQEAALAVKHGASAVGLVSRMPSGPGPIPQERIRSIARIVPPGVATFLLSSETTTRAIVDQQRYCGTNTLQLVDDEISPEVRQELAQTLPGIAIVQVIHVADESAIERAIRAADTCDAILLDSGRPKATIRELGGTGRAHDWAISRKIRDSVGVPVYLAGGLSAENVERAIGLVEPFGVDVCSGLRTDGRLDERKLNEFMSAVGHAAGVAREAGR
ncbi:MAG TPA: phosphoribosylanthranilate isomerase [Gemmatimonadaceae bacterium]|nr:phosphoribosylanthranilate isomerase [Gemmatimonadaceae bacterium]